MKKIFNYAVVTVLLSLVTFVSSCGGGNKSSDTSSYETDTTNYETSELEEPEEPELPSVQSEFFGVSFGMAHETVLKQLIEAGYTVDEEFENENRSLFYSDKEISFGGTTWNWFYTYYVNGKFGQILFVKSFEDEEDARQLYSRLSNGLGSKYGEMETFTPGDDMLALSGITCKDGWIRLCIEKSKSSKGLIGSIMDKLSSTYFYVELCYSMDEISEQVSSDL